MFQFACVTFWFYDGYYIMAMAVLIISTVFSYIKIKEVKSNHEQVRKGFSGTYKVQRKIGDNTVETDSSELLPGDKIFIKSDTSLVCDLILLNGQVFTDESMRTGESVPDFKCSLPDSSNGDKLYGEDEAETNRSTLYGGTKVKRSTKVTKAIGTAVFHAYGLVKDTGFTSQKGALVREILFNKKAKQSYRDQVIFIFIMLGLVIASNNYTVPIQEAIGVPKEIQTSRTLDSFTIAVPPTLFAALSFGAYNAVKRLQKHKIFCVTPRSINLAGQVKTFIFDKTGTLTKEDLEL